MDDEFDEVIGEFLIESHENLDRLDQDLLDLEANPEDPATLASAFRTIHTIKGTCGFLGFSHLERVAHVGENLLSRLRDGAISLDAVTTTALLAMVDAVRTMLGDIEATGADGDEPFDSLVERLSALQEPEAARPPVGDVLVAAGVAEPADVTLALVEQDLGDTRPLGRILVDHGAVEESAVERAIQGRDGGDTLAPPRPPMDSSGGGSSDARSGISESTIRVDVVVLDRLMNLVGELVLSRNNILQHVDASAGSSITMASQQLDLITGELQECVTKTRMQPIGSVWAKFSRVVRDLSTQCGKEVRIEMEGEETELDKTILEAIKDPLTHVVRNTVDHGIETPSARLAAGKPSVGTLRLRARHEGGQVVIEISDDGGGIDTDKVRRTAVSRGIVTSDHARTMSEREAVLLIFSPGFSTADAVTTVSGRGVGMDVVKTNIERIGGTVDVETQLGEGTVLRIKIPLTLAIVPALMCEVAEQRFAIPQIEVQELVRLDGDDAQDAVEMVHNAPVYRLRGQLIPLVSLREQLGMPAAPESMPVTIAVVAAEGRPWGLVVDGVTTNDEIVVKPLGSIMRTVHAFSGATIMGDGRIALILDIARIARVAEVVSTVELVRDGWDPDDDSLTTSSGKVLIVARGDDQVGIDLTRVERLEQFRRDDLERSDRLDVVKYRGSVLPIVPLGEPGDQTTLVTIVFECGSALVGLVVDRIVDIVDASMGAGDSGPAGTIIVRDRVTEMLDLDAVLRPASAWVGRNLVGVPA